MNDLKNRKLINRISETSVILRKDSTFYFKDFSVSCLSLSLFSHIPCVFKGEAPDLSALEATHESLKFFNHYYLAGHDFCVGNNLTVADFSLVATISNIIEFEIDMSKYPNITAWFENVNLKCLAEIRDVIK
ncbi:hypothetical protein Avbf_15256 [Armadillidium vulgare]|nr:hypothetical protein Avbf_15256 [Armadillidium vulgare]